MYLKNLYILLFLFHGSHIFCQNDIKESINLHSDSLECNSQLCIERIDPESLHDTIIFEGLIHELLCHKSLSYEEFKSKLDSLDALENDLRFAAFSTKNYNFYKRNKSDIIEGKWMILYEAYKKALRQKDHLDASKYAEKLYRSKSKRQDRQDKQRWRMEELLQFQKYAKDDYIKLIKFHESNLFMDTTEILVSDPPFRGYDHLVKVIAHQYTSSVFASVLDKALESTTIYPNDNTWSVKYSLKFILENKEFYFIHEDYSRLYLRDTIVMDTFIDFHSYIEDRYSGDQIMVRQDTIYNQIDDFNEMSAYREKLKRSLLFRIVEDLKRME